MKFRPFALAAACWLAATGARAAAGLSVTVFQSAGLGAPVQPGDPLSWTVIVTNTGTTTADAITGYTGWFTIAQLLPTGAGSATGTLTCTTDPGIKMAWNNATAGLVAWSGTMTLGPGESATGVITAAAACVPAPTSVTVAPYASVAALSAAAGSVSLVAEPLVSVSLWHAPQVPQPGTPLTYTLTVLNPGPSVALTQTVTAVLPANAFWSASVFTTVVSADPLAGWSVSVTGAGTVVWTATMTLLAGQTTTATFSGTAFCYAGGSLAATVQAGASVACASAAAVDVFAPIGPNVTLAKTWINPDTGTQKPYPTRGHRVQFVLTLANAGTATAGSVTVVDTLPVGQASFATSTAPAGWSAALDGSGTVLTFSRTWIAPGEVAEFSVFMTVNDDLTPAFTVLNNAWVTFASDCGGVLVAAAASSPMTQSTKANETAIFGLGDGESAPYPSPARGDSRIAYLLHDPGKVTIAIYNAAGRRVDTITEDKGAGPQESKVSTSKFQPGLYYYILEVAFSDGSTQRFKTQKLVVIR